MLAIFVRLLFLSSWSTIYFLPKKSVKRYLPVTIFAALMAVTTVLIGTPYKFWGVKGSSKKGIWNHLALILGPFPVANL